MDTPSVNVQMTLSEFKNNVKDQNRIVTEMPYKSFLKIFDHYMMCVLDSDYLETIDMNNCVLKQLIKTFNLSRVNIATDILTKTKFENTKLFNILSWVYSAVKIDIYDTVQTDSNLCYISSERINGSDMVLLFIYSQDKQNTPRFVTVSQRFKRLIYNYFIFTHVENEIQMLGKQWLLQQSWYYSEGVDVCQKLERLKNHNRGYIPKYIYLQYTKVMTELKETV